MVVDSIKIVTLLPSATELVCALGLQESLVGRSHECDFPATIQSLPVCTQASVDLAGTSSDIDTAIQQIGLRQQTMPTESSASLYAVSAQILSRLKPSHIITQAQCDVCAVNLVNVESAISEVPSFSPEIISLGATTLTGIWNEVLLLATALGAAESGVELVTNLEERLARIESLTKTVPVRPRVAVIEWATPLMAAGNWTPELIQIAGGDNLFGSPGQHSPWIDYHNLTDKDPDVILIAPCGYDLDRTARDIGLLEKKPEWNQLRAVHNDQVFIADGNQFFNRPGPRLVESVEILAEILHPQLFEFGHEGFGWKRYRPS